VGWDDMMKREGKTVLQKLLYFLYIINIKSTDLK